MIKEILHTTVINYPDEMTEEMKWRFNECNKRMFDENTVFAVEPNEEYNGDTRGEAGEFVQRTEGTFVVKFYPDGGMRFCFEPYSDKNPIPEFKK